MIILKFDNMHQEKLLDLYYIYTKNYHGRVHRTLECYG